MCPRARARAPRSSCCASTDLHVLPGPQAKGVADWPPKGEIYPRTTDVDGGLEKTKAQKKILGKTISLGTWPMDRAYDDAFDDAYKVFCSEIRAIMARHDGQAWDGADGVRNSKEVNESIHKIQAAVRLAPAPISLPVTPSQAACPELTVAPSLARAPLGREQQPA